MFKAYKEQMESQPRQLTKHEQQIENNEAFKKNEEFMRKFNLMKPLREKFVKQGMSYIEAGNKARNLVESGAHIFEDIDETENTVKNNSSLTKTSEIYKLINKALLLVNNIASKHKGEPKYEKLKKYFSNLNKKVK